MAVHTFKSVVKRQKGIAVEVESRGFKVTIDEPKSLGGSDTGMNPVELLLGSLGACQVITALSFAPAKGIKIEDIRVELEGDLDLDSFNGKNPNAEKGYSEIRYHFYIKSEASQEDLHKLIEFVEDRCPVGHTLLKQVKFGAPKLTIE